MALIKGFRDLNVYKLPREQAQIVFKISKSFPIEERYSLTDQIRRSSRAVNAMIAEAWARRRYIAAFISKIDDALGEAMETQAWLDHAFDSGYISAAQHKQLDAAWQSVGAMLNRMIERAEDFCRNSGKLPRVMFQSSLSICCTAGDRFPSSILHPPSSCSPAPASHIIFPQE